MSRRRFRGSVIGRYVRPTTTTASGVYDLDTQILNTGISRWPAATAFSYRIPGQAIFGPGANPAGSNVSNLVSNTGVIGTDTTGFTSYRSNYGALGYGIDKAMFAGGTNSTGPTTVSLVNYITNTGSVGADSSVSGFGKSGTTGATYGIDKGLFSCGAFYSSGIGSANNTYTLVTNTGVYGSAPTISMYHDSSNAVGYADDLALFVTNFSRGSPTGGGVSEFRIHYVTNTGSLASEATSANSSNHAGQGQATRYGTGTAIFTAFNTASTKYIAYITNTGVIGSDQTVTPTARSGYACTTYNSSGDAIGAFGANPSGTPYLNTKFLISSAGVLAADSTGAGTARNSVAAAGYGS